uniref:SHSP domain-containing protein n=1 Tax=Bionectria ochroleuca TaxID=29856 RepID=A0A8H7N4B6_BIOOC
MALQSIRFRINFPKYQFLKPRIFVASSAISFTPRCFHTPAPEFNTFMRFLDNIARYSRESGIRGLEQNFYPPFQPNFDVTELDNAYELYGELPGLNKHDIHIELVDGQTLVIQRKIERSSNNITGDVESGHNKQTGSVEQGDVNSSDAYTQTRVKESNQARLWVAERNVGEFSRTFSFPHNIQQDKIEASLNSGPLSVRVPKKEKSLSHSIEIN